VWRLREGIHPVLTDEGGAILGGQRVDFGGAFPVKFSKLRLKRCGPHGCEPLGERVWKVAG
jgi:hypothetical protein